MRFSSPLDAVPEWAGTATQRTLRALSTLVSFVFHPVFMPVVMVLLLFRLAPINFAGLQVGHPLMAGSLANLLFIVAMLTVFFPLLAIGLMKALGLIRTIEMHESKDRILPLMAMMIFYFWAQHVMGNMTPAPPLVMRLLLLGSFWGIATLFFVSIFFKISMHAAAAGGMVGLFATLLFINPIDMTVPLFIALLLAGLIGTARLILRAHKPAEVWTGYLLGAAVQVAAYFYLT